MSPTPRQDVEVLRLPSAAVHALATGDREAANRTEVSYAVLPELRRRGYARAMLEALLARAADEPAVRVVRASVSPDNAPSLGLISQYGFVRVGEQWDDEDGLEIVYEVPAGRC